MLKWIADLFSKYKVIVHITNETGEAFKAQQKLKQAGINFKKEIEDQGSVYAQTYFGGNTPSTIKLKVSLREEHKAREVLDTY